MGGGGAVAAKTNKQTKNTFYVRLFVYITL